jgi:hypothetical protein
VKKVPTHCYDQVSLSFVIVILIIFMIGSWGNVLSFTFCFEGGAGKEEGQWICF